MRYLAMRSRVVVSIISLIFLGVTAGDTHAQGTGPLRLVQTITMPNVKGRMDHLGVDIKGTRSFAAELNNNTVEVIDLKAGKQVFNIPGQSKPQGIFYSTDFKRLFVANGIDGTCKIYSGDKFTLIDSLTLGTNPNHVGYDTATKYIFVGLA